MRSGFASDHTKPSTDPRYFSLRSLTTRFRSRWPYCPSARSVRPSVGRTAARSSISSDEEMRCSTVGGIMRRGQSTTIYQATDCTDRTESRSHRDGEQGRRNRDGGLEAAELTARALHTEAQRRGGKRRRGCARTRRGPALGPPPRATPPLAGGAPPLRDRAAPPLLSVPPFLRVKSLFRFLRPPPFPPSLLLRLCSSVSKSPSPHLSVPGTTAAAARRRSAPCA